MKIPKSQIPTEGNHRIGHCYRVLNDKGRLCNLDRCLVSVTPNTTSFYDTLTETSEYAIFTGACSTTYKQLSDRHLYNLLRD